MGNSRTIIISDLHLSAGRLDDCDGVLDAHICSFIDAVAEGGEAATELIVNGDFLDFVQAPPLKGKDLRGTSSDGVSLCFTEEQSRQKLRAILREHDEVIRSMGRFLERSKGNFITILPGNHDADLFWPKVREDFFAALRAQTSGVGRLQFWLGGAYRPAFHPTIWVEHGHQYDAINRFYSKDQPLWSSDTPPIMQDRQGVDRLVECTGTRFLNLFLNNIDREYHFVDNVKPFSRFLAIFGRSSLYYKYGPVKAGLAILAMLRYLSITLCVEPNDLLAVSGSKDDSLEFRLTLTRLLEGLSESSQAAIMEKAESSGFGGEPLFMILNEEEASLSLIDFIGERFDEVAPLLDDDTDDNDDSYLSADSPQDSGLLSLGEGFLQNETFLLQSKAQLILAEHGMSHVVMGHTHEAVSGGLANNYFNLGCWIRYYDADEQTTLTSWDVLREPYGKFPFRLHYLFASEEVKLCVFKEGCNGR